MPYNQSPMVLSGPDASISRVRDEFDRRRIDKGRTTNVIQSAKPSSVCLLDRDRSALWARSRALSEIGWEVRPFTDPETFIEYARIYCPETAVVDFGGSRGEGMKVATRVKEVSPTTAVIISLKVHRAEARSMLEGEELIKLIGRPYVTISPQPFAAGDR